MKNKLIDLLEQPEALEALYRSEPKQFTLWLDEALSQFPQSETLNVWHARLSFTPKKVSPESKTPLVFVIILSLLAGFLTKLPSLFQIKEDWFYPRFIPIIVIGMLIAYFMRKCYGSLYWKIVLAGLFLCVVFMLLLPFERNSSSIIMSQLHMPLVLGSLLALVFMAENWKLAHVRLHYIRYIGEMLIYATLILIGGIILTIITLGLFNLIGLSIDNWYTEYIVVLGLVASPIVATYLYDSVLGSDSKVASLLSNVFAPLFLITVVIYLLAIFVQGKNPYLDRDFLIVFNGLLVVIWAISVFSIAGKSDDTDSGLLDYINIALLAVTLVINAVALSAILFRWSVEGITPNRVAVTGANILIFVHLLLILKEYIRHVKLRNNPVELTHVVASYLPIYSSWSLFVVLILPVLFSFK